MVRSVAIAASAMREIEAHGEHDYPNEACGLLIGSKSGDRIVIDESVPVANLNRERARDRYDLDPRGQLDADRRARKTGRDIVGVYHSHPDHPAQPSEFDRSHGYPEWVYVIVRVDRGRADDAGAFLLTGEQGSFEPMEMLIA